MKKSTSTYKMSKQGKIYLAQLRSQGRLVGEIRKSIIDSELVSNYRTTKKSN
jgi:hypothetical protein